MNARAIALALSLLLAGCGTDETVPLSRVPTAAPDAGSDSAPPEAGLPIRTISLGNPLGRVDPNNLMVDGDFELTSASGQFGWRAIASTGEAELRRETGGLCRSGVTCGVLTPDADFLGYAAGPGASDVEVRVYTKPPRPDCTLTAVSLIGCTSAIVFRVDDVASTSSEPASDGWCEHHVVTPAMEHRPCLLVTSFADAGESTLVDDAWLGKAPSRAPRSLAFGPPRAERAERVARTLRIAEATTRIGRPERARP